MPFVGTLFLMTLLQRLARTGPLEARATLALGFLLIAAYLGGEIARRFRLPRITGFLVTGFLAGPAWLDVVRADEIDALRFIWNGALALIAFAAGGELKVATLRAERAALVRLTAAAVAFPFAAVTFVVLTVSPWFPLTAHQPFGDAVAVALVLGTVAAVSSPAITMALITDTGGGPGARGPFSRTILGVTAAQDVVAIVLLPVMLVVAQLAASRGAVSPGIAASAFLHLAGSVAAGVLLGYAVTQYLKVITRHLVLFLVAVAFVVAQAVRLGGLETMLIALAAGFYVANFAPAEGGGARLKAELARSAVPVYVVFFALAGSGLRLDALGELWPWALLLIALRITSLRAGLRWAGHHPAVSLRMATHGWLGLVSQAGLAIGLAAALRRAFPEWGVSLESLLVAMIGVHEIAGPICLQRALRTTGEVTEDHHVADKPDSSQPVLVPGDGGGGGGM